MIDFLDRTNKMIAAAVITAHNGWEIYQYNDCFAKMFAVSEQNKRLDIFEEDRKCFEQLLEESTTKQTETEGECRIVMGDGNIRWFEIKANFTEEKEGVSYICVALWDIEEKKQLEMRIQMLEEQYDVMEQLADEIPFDLDVKKWQLLRSRRISVLKGEESGNDIYVPFEEEIKNIHPIDREGFVNAMKQAMVEEKAGYVECRYNLAPKHQIQKYIWMRVYYKSILDSEGKIVRIIGRYRDIERNVRLREKAKLDSLTGILNKGEVRLQVEETLKKEPQATHIMFLIDIDNFKQINDSFGHTFGDTVIEDVAEDLKSQLNSGDIIGRVGGDEFLVFMRNTDIDRAVEKAEKICEILRKEYSGGNVIRYISVSIGMSVAGLDGTTYDELFSKADYAMYHAKESGKDNYSLARGSDTQMPNGRKREFEQRNDMKKSEQDFLAFAINILSHARNIDGSLNLVLEKMLSRYKLDMIMVLEELDDGSGFTLINIVGNKLQMFENTVFQRQGYIDKTSAAGDVISIPKNSILSWIETARKQGIEITEEIAETTSILLGKFETFNNSVGACSFITFDKERVWEEADYQIFGELSRIIGVFVSLKARLDETNARIRIYQNRDILTGLLNLDSFKSEYRNAVAKNIKGGVLALEYFDINNFGYVNENYGYQIGDKILKYFAHDIMDNKDALLGCRLYSDFFLLLKRGNDEEEIKKAVRDSQRKFVNLHNHQYPSSGLSVSAGIYFIEDEKIDVDLAIENATLAWKRAKRESKTHMEVFCHELRDQRSEEQRVVGEFYEALYRGDFKMYLQPKFNLKTRTIYGAEALARWQKPDGHIIPPFKFIDSLENIGYITDLDFYIFEELLKTLAKWKLNGRRDIVVSVNFSGRHFDKDGNDFMKRLVTIMKKYPVPASQIEIEITEGVMAKNYDGLKKALNELRDRGFRVAVDDFGTGYSSLAVLTDIPADVIKIDKSFLEKEFSERNLSVLMCIGNLIETVGRETILEGIETIEQLKKLSDCGFIYGQGYVCDKPIPVSDFEKLYL